MASRMERKSVYLFLVLGIAVGLIVGCGQEELEESKPWMDDVLSPAVVKHMPEWDRMLTPLIKESIDEIEEEQRQETGETDTAGQADVTAKIIEEGKTAYVSIRSFDGDSYDDDKEQLFSFYQAVRGYDNLIIDITENDGGGMGYYRELIVAPNIDRPLYWLNYLFMKDGANNRKYSPDGEEGFLALDTPPEQVREGMLSCLDEEDKEAAGPLLASVGIPAGMNEGDLRDLDLYKPSLNSIKPSAGKKMFDGRIWVLVSGQVYSASESFATFCKATGFATLVGTRTRGDGIGSTPPYFVLPNSGLVGRYSIIYGVTQDGRGSEEFGTEPDDISPDGESALDTCLRVIEAGTDAALQRQMRRPDE